MYNVDSKDQFRIVAQARRDFYQVPFDPNDPNTAGTFLKDINREDDEFVAFSRVRAFGAGPVLTVSPFYHHNSANYESSPLDLPSSTMDDRSSNYEGGQATVSWVEKRNNLRPGLYGFAQQDYQRFGLIVNDNSGLSLTPRTWRNPLAACSRFMAKISLPSPPGSG